MAAVSPFTGNSFFFTCIDRLYVSFSWFCVFDITIYIFIASMKLFFNFWSVITVYTRLITY